MPVGTAAAGAEKVTVPGPLTRAQLRVMAPGGEGFPSSDAEPWSVAVALGVGEHGLASRATDARGRAQPERPLWNELGYGNNSVHRVTVGVA